MTGPDLSLLRAEEAVVRYPAPGGGLLAVRGVSLDIRPGEIVALVGESGSGKTSLARAVLGLQSLESGRVLYRGRDVAGMDRAGLRTVRRSVQAVFQDPLDALSPRRTILQSLREPLDHFGLGAPSSRLDRAAEALATVDLPSALLERYPHELSGGQRQRIALARALVAGPELIVADEPLSSLDPPLRARIIELIAGIRRRLGVAFLLVSHDLSLVRQLADAVAVMYLGTVVESGPAGRLFGDPAHPYTRSLLNAVPTPDPRQPPPAVPRGEAPSGLTPQAGCVFHRRCPEHFEPCPTRQPSERTVAGTAQGGKDGAGEPQRQHRVRCHLWNN